MGKYKFKVGDVVIAAVEHYNITKKGWIGKVKEISNTGSDQAIVVRGVGRFSKDGEFTVASIYFELYNSKNKQKMATKKKAAVTKAASKGKAVAKKPTAVATKATECDIELTDGDYFSAEYRALRSKAAPIKISGVVVETDYSGGSVSFVLCNKSVGAEADGQDEFEGFNYGLSVTVRAGESVKKALEKSGITNCIICNDARQKKVIDEQKNPEIVGYRVRKNGDEFIFGCGDFSITENHLKAVLRVAKACSAADLKIYVDVATEVMDTDRVNIAEITAAEIESLLKM